MKRYVILVGLAQKSMVRCFICVIVLEYCPQKNHMSEDFLMELIRKDSSISFFNLLLKLYPLIHTNSTTKFTYTQETASG
jgi:hypothetical protein